MDNHVPFQFIVTIELHVAYVTNVSCGASVSKQVVTALLHLGKHLGTVRTLIGLLYKGMALLMGKFDIPRFES